MTPLVDLRELRVNRGLSIREAARQMGVEHRALLRAEKGETTPHVGNAYRIAAFYDLRVTDVWPLDPVPTSGEAA